MDMAYLVTYSAIYYLWTAIIYSLLSTCLVLFIFAINVYMCCAQWVFQRWIHGLCQCHSWSNSFLWCI